MFNETNHAVSSFSLAQQGKLFERKTFVLDGTTNAEFAKGTKKWLDKLLFCS